MFLKIKHIHNVKTRQKFFFKLKKNAYYIYAVYSA